MAEIFLMKAGPAMLVPEREEDAEVIKAMKPGALVKCVVTVPADPVFHRRMFKLLQVSYDFFCERKTGGAKFRGELVKPSFDRFRKDLTILAGFYDPVYCINGETRLEAKSLSYAKCDQPTKEKIYSAFIDAAIKHVYENSRSEEWLRAAVERLLMFAG